MLIRGLGQKQTWKGGSRSLRGSVCDGGCGSPEEASLSPGGDTARYFPRLAAASPLLPLQPQSVHTCPLMNRANLRGIHWLHSISSASQSSNSPGAEGAMGCCSPSFPGRGPVLLVHPGEAHAWPAFVPSAAFITRIHLLESHITGNRLPSKTLSTELPLPDHMAHCAHSSVLHMASIPPPCSPL